MRAPTLLMLAEVPPGGIRPLEDAVGSALSGGVDAVLLRDAKAAPGPLLEAARALRRITRGRARLLIHGDEALAGVCEADGVHLPARALASPGPRLSAGMILGFSVHSSEEAGAAAAKGADYLLAGTIYSSASHPGMEAAGLALLEALRASTPLPTVAIGGVVPENAAACLKAGAAGVAARSPFLAAADPGFVARRYREAMASAGQIQLMVNGRQAYLCGPQSLADFISSRGLRPERVAVERNLEIVPRSRYPQTLLSSGDRLEIVQMMAGG